MVHTPSPKSELLLFLSKQQGELISNNQMKIFQDYQELNEVLNQIKDKDYNIFKFIYHHRNKIHSLLYDFDEIIKINEFKLKFDFTELYYLNLLIVENDEIINYTCTFDTLNGYKNVIKKFDEENNITYKMISYKMILNLINNYCNSHNDEEINEEEINKIINENENGIKNNIDKFKNEFNIKEENIREMRIDILYCEILISLIKFNNFDNYDYLYNILNVLELEKIDIGNAILIPLQETLKENNDYMKKFIIKTEEDLHDEKIVNFYYILLKYILKSEIFIYQIPFLLEAKKRIIKLIKSDKIIYIKKNILNQEIIKRYKYIIEILSGSKYFFEIKKDEIYRLKKVLKYYKLFYFESRVKDKEKIELDIKNKNKKSEYLKFYDEAVKGNNIYPLIKNLYFTSNNKEINSEKSLNESIKKFENVIRTIKDRKFVKLANRKIYANYFKDKNNYEILLNVFTRKDIYSLINYAQKNINNNRNSSKHNLFNNNKKLIDDKFKQNKFAKSDITKLQQEKKEVITYENTYIISHNNTEMELQKIIENKNSNIGFIKEINGEYFLYIKDDKVVVLLDKHFNKVLEINDYNDKILIVFAINSDKDKMKNLTTNKEDHLEIVLYSYNFVFLTSINLQEKKTNTKKYDISEITFILKDLSINLDSKSKEIFLMKIPYIKNISFLNSILINENILALISNSDDPEYKHILKFYNLIEKKYYQREIRGYSFILSPNGLELLPKLNKENKFRILLCACKKYNKGQKNGILLINPQIEENKDIEHPFNNTDNFEVFCFCQLLYDKGENNGEAKFIDTNYFLVGGYDTNLKKGKIFLYKMKYGERAYNTTIEYVQEIVIKEGNDINSFDGFNASINCIKQSIRTGNILVGCSNGNIYILTPPDLNYFLEKDAEEKNM